MQNAALSVGVDVTTVRTGYLLRTVRTGVRTLLNAGGRLPPLQQNRDL